MINCDAESFLEREVLISATALANSGGGALFLEGERLTDGKLRRELCDYISENTNPQIFPLSDVLFPETNVKITIPFSETLVSTLRGSAYGIDNGGRIVKLFEKLKIKAEETAITVNESTDSALDRETAAKVAKRLGRNEKYAQIDCFMPEVLYTVTGAVRFDGEKLLPTAWGIIAFGKEDAVRDLCPNVGAAYTAYTPKRKKKRSVFIYENLFSQRETLIKEILKDSRACRAAECFSFVFSHALFTALSLRDTEKRSQTKVYNRNGVIEISFPLKKSKAQTFGSEKSAFSGDIGRLFKKVGYPFFKTGARKAAEEMLKAENFLPIKIEKRKTFGRITVDFFHKTV